MRKLLFCSTLAVMAMVACTSDEWFDFENPEESINYNGTRADINYEYLDIKESSFAHMTDKDWEVVAKARTRLTVIIQKDGQASIKEKSGKEVNISERVYEFIKTSYKNGNEVLLGLTEKKTSRKKRSSVEGSGHICTWKDCVGHSISYNWLLNLETGNATLQLFYPSYSSSGIPRADMLDAVRIFSLTANKYNRYVGASFFNCSLNGILVISNHAENAESIERSYVKTTYTLNSYDSQSAKYRSYEILGDTVPSLSPNGNVVINDYIK